MFIELLNSQLLFTTSSTISRVKKRTILSANALWVIVKRFRHRVNDMIVGGDVL